MSYRYNVTAIAALLCGMLAFPSFDVSAGEIRGILRDHGGAAMPSGWRVMAHGVDHGGGAMALTDDSGSFSLTGLPEGRTAVLFYPPYADEAVLDPKAGRMIRVSADGVAEMELWLDSRETAVSTFDFTYYHGEFYDNKATAETATPVLLPDQGSVTVDMELSPGGGSISGRVTREVDGSSVAGIIVWAGSDSAFSFDRTDENGSYRITGLAAGSNVVAAGVLFGPTQGDVVGEYYLNSSPWDASAVPVSNDSDTPDIDFELAQAGSVSGRVTSEVDGLGVPDMIIDLQYTLNNDAIYFNVWTDASGFYQVGGLRPGSWWVGARGGNWLPEYWNNRPHGQDPDFVLVTAGENTSGIDLVLTPGGRITGTVTHEISGAPLQSRVQVWGGGGQHTFTDEAGRYAIEGLTPGKHQVYALALNKWWNNQDSPELADSVEVVSNGTATGIDFAGRPENERCESHPGGIGIIRGTIVDETKSPIADYRVSLFEGSFLDNHEIRTVFTNSEGQYEFTCVLAGDYLVKANGGGYGHAWQNEWYDNANEAQADLVTVNGQQVTDGIDFVLAAGGTIGGRLTGPGGVPLTGFYMTVEDPNGYQQLFATGPDGQWQVTSGPEGGLKAGNYIVRALGGSTADFNLVPVLLSRFSATTLPGQSVRLEWTTGREVSHSGFHVERASIPGGPADRLTGSLLTGGPDYEFVDLAPLAGEAWYWLVAVDRDGRVERFGPLAVSMKPAAVSRFLGPAANPSRETASIRWELAREAHVRLDVFDALGRRIRTLVDGLRPEGAGSALWDGVCSNGSRAAAGQYYLRFETPDGAERASLTLVR